MQGQIDFKYQEHSQAVTEFFNALSPVSLSSRVHRLRDGRWLKRDDELGAITGSGKTRKWASLLPALKQAQVQEVVLWGGAQSNHLVSAVAHLREAGIGFTIFCRTTNHNQIDGNRLLLHLLTEEAAIKWIEKNDVEEAAQQYAHARRKSGVTVLVLPEGAAHPLAIPGAASLGLDILRNEQECGVCWQHVWVDAGTGLSAQALIALWMLLGIKKTVHVVGMAGDEAAFRQGIGEAVQTLLAFMQTLNGFAYLRSCDPQNMTSLCGWRWHEPPTARSFGAINQQVRAEVLRMAREEGVLLDPLYGAKLLLAFRQNPTTEATLLVHSGVGGGLFSLMKP